jgi:hypothetical protein
MTMIVVPSVISGATDDNLIDLDEIKSELKIDPDDTSNDVWLERTIGQVSRSISSYCNRRFHVERMQDAFYIQQDPYPYQVPGGVGVLQLSRWPVKTLESVTQRFSADSTNALTNGTDFALDGENGELLRLDSGTGINIRWEALPTTVLYSAGYDDIPDDVVVAALRWMVWRWSERTRDPTLKATQQPDYGTKSYWVGGPPMSGGVPQEIASLLNNYRSPVVY